MTQKIVANLERAGVLSSRRFGTIREVSLNPEFIIAKELNKLLLTLLEKEPRYSELLRKVGRRRPRRSGKAL